MQKKNVVPRKPLTRYLPLLAAAIVPIMGAVVIAVYIRVAEENLDLDKLPSSVRELRAAFTELTF